MNSKVAAVIQTIDLLPSPCCLVDTNSRYLHYNLAYLKMIGAENYSRFELIGKTVADMPCKAASCAEIFWEEDAEVKRTKKTVTVLNTIKMENDQWWVVQIDKTPIINDHNEVEAIIFTFVNHSNNHFLDLALQLSKNLNPADKSDNGTLLRIKLKNDHLTLGSKESTILYYLIKGLPYKEIAAIQDVSYSTVVDHVERLKNKFNAATLDELIKNALLNGYPTGAPENLFDQQFGIIFCE